MPDASLEICDAAVHTQITVTATGVVDDRRSGNYFNDFAVADLESVRNPLNDLVQTLPDLGYSAPINEDAPLFFDVNLLAEHLERIATEQGGNICWVYFHTWTSGSRDAFRPAPRCSDRARLSNFF